MLSCKLHSGLSCYSASQHSYDMNCLFTSRESACSFLGYNKTILPLDSCKPTYVLGLGVGGKLGWRSRSSAIIKMRLIMQTRLF